VPISHVNAFLHYLLVLLDTPKEPGELNMTERWRSMVSDLSPEERRHLADDVLGVDISTLNRWASGVYTPRKPQDIRKLAEVIPGMQEALLEVEEFRKAFDINYAIPDALEVPPAYTASILSMLANTAETMAQYTIHNHVYQYILSQLDEHREGMLLLFVQCVEPATDGDVTSLYVHPSGCGTGPWHTQQIARPLYAGSGTLCGLAVSTGQPAYPQDKEQLRRGMLHQERIQSIAAFPILRWGKVAGALLVASVHEEFFTPVRIELLKSYTNLFALGLITSHFYAMDRIKLRSVPSPQHQAMLLQEFSEFMEDLADRYPEYRDRPEADLERFAWQKIQEMKQEKKYADK
jgi:GAF domain-containing protein